VTTVTANIRYGALLLACLGAASCAETLPEVVAAPAGPRTSVDDEDLWALAPGESETLIWADMAQLRTSDWTQSTVTKTATDERAARAEVRGFDEVTDVDRLLYVTVPPLREGASVFLAQGRLNRDRIEKAFRVQHHGAVASDYRGVAMLVEGEDAIAFMTARTVASGPLVAVRASIDCGFGLAKSVATETWLSGLRGIMAEDKGAKPRPPAMAAAVHMTPTMRTQFEEEMGEGGTLEKVGARLDLGTDLELSMVGVVGNHQQALDLAARLSTRLREQRNRPIFFVLGLQAILDSVHFATQDNRVEAGLRIPKTQRADIAERMALVAQHLARRRQSDNPPKASAPKD
jgi:hypothetical protein